MPFRPRFACLFAACAALLSAGTASAQSFQLNLGQTPSGGFANNSFTENVDFADVDLDGDWDAVFADGGDFGNDQSRVWLNQGGLQGGTIGFFSDATAARFPAVLAAARDIEFADLDEDGDADIYLSDTSSQSNQTNRWWINMGGAQGGSSGFYQDQTAARWVGLGGAGSSVSPSLVLGGGGFVDFSCDCDFGDLDNDGDLDLVHSSYGGFFLGLVPARLFLNDGAGNFAEFNPSGFQLSGSHIADGNPGLWCEGTQQAGTTDATGAFCDVALTTLDLEVGDIDGDLDLDLLLGARNELPRLYANRLEESGALAFRDVGSALFPAGYSFGQGHYAQEFGDLDGDDDLDLYGLNWQVPSPGVLDDITLQNDGTGTYSNATLMTNSSSDDNEADFIDYDADGDLDVLVANFGGRERLYRNNWTGGAFSYTPVTGAQMPFDDSQSLDLDGCDVDADGDTDAFVANDEGEPNAFLLNITGIADTHAPRVGILEQAPDRACSNAPTVVRAQVYDNAPYYIVWYADVELEYSLNGGSFTSAPMRSSAGQVFRGEIPGTLAGTIDYRVSATDEHGNSSTSATKTYNGCDGALAAYCTAKTNSSGCTPAIGGTGSPSASAGSGFVIDAAQVLPAKAGLLFYGTTGPGGGPFQGGHLCATPPTRRTPIRTSTSAGAPPCTGLYAIDFNVRIASGMDPALVLGQQVWSQWWSRDGGVPSGTGLSNGLTFTICP